MMPETGKIMQRALCHGGTRALQTPRLLLRRFAPGDERDCLAFRADPAVWRWLSGQPESAEDVRAWLAGADEAYRSGDTYYWAIVNRADGVVIGELFVDDFGSKNRWCELDWRLAPAYWGNGYAAEAAKCAMAYLLETVGFHRVQAKCAAENHASQRVMQKLGMRQEGVLREAFRDRDGVYHDLTLYALIG